MRKLLLFIFIFSTFKGSTQNRPVVDIQPISKIDSVDMYRFMALLEMDANKYIISPKFKDYYCNVLIYEYRKGQLTKSINFRDSLKKATADFDYTFSVEDGAVNDKFEVALYSQKLGDSLLKVYSCVGKMGFNCKLRLDQNSSYSWKEVFEQPSKKHELKPGTLYPLLTYSKPVGKEFTRIEGASEFCKISGEFIPFNDWYKELGIEHYFIVFIRLEQ